MCLFKVQEDDYMGRIGARRKFLRVPFFCGNRSFGRTELSKKETEAFF